MAKGERIGAPYFLQILQLLSTIEATADSRFRLIIESATVYSVNGIVLIEDNTAVPDTINIYRCRSNGRNLREVNPAIDSRLLAMHFLRRNCVEESKILYLTGRFNNGWVLHTFGGAGDADKWGPACHIRLLRSSHSVYAHSTLHPVPMLPHSSAHQSADAADIPFRAFGGVAVVSVCPGEGRRRLDTPAGKLLHETNRRIFEEKE